MITFRIIASYFGPRWKARAGSVLALSCLYNIGWCFDIRFFFISFTGIASIPRMQTRSDAVVIMIPTSSK
jgi:hypothetical protein